MTVAQVYILHVYCGGGGGGGWKNIRSPGQKLGRIFDTRVKNQNSSDLSLFFI
jgi:hypothetical protein